MQALNAQAIRKWESPLPGPVFYLFAGIALLGLLTINPLLTLAAILSIPVYILLLWRPGEPPVLLFIVAYQWLQVTAKVFHANVQGVHITEMSQAASVEEATWLSLIGLLVLALGIRFALRWMPPVSLERVREEAARVSIEKAFLFYLAGTFSSGLIGAVGWSEVGLGQAARVLGSVKWIGLFILGYLVLTQHKRYPYLLAAIAIEVIGGIGFFSGFKFVLFVAMIIVGTAFTRLNVKKMLYGGVAIAALLVMGSGWTVIKSEFRGFLNEGSGRQSVGVSEAEMMEKLGSLISDLSWADIQEGMDPMFRRVAYVDYFAHTIDYVPEYEPHTKGEVWRGNVMHMLTPRFLFPSKPALPSDSEFTMYYTGLHMASGAQGTSISIGYFGEGYIDFGRYGMFVPIFLVGMLWGLMYVYFMRRVKVTLLAFAVAMTVLIMAHMFEMVGVKLLGGMVTRFLVWAILIAIIQKPLWAWLQRSDAAPEPDGAAPAPYVPPYGSPQARLG
jgi:hypothetical protein